MHGSDRQRDRCTDHIRHGDTKASGAAIERQVRVAGPRGMQHGSPANRGEARDVFRRHGHTLRRRDAPLRLWCRVSYVEDAACAGGSEGDG